MNVVQIALVALAVALFGALGWMTDWGQDLTSSQVVDKPIAAKTDPTTVLPDFKLGSEGNAYALIAEKPLLNPTRKPAPTQAVAVAAPEPPKPQIRRGLYQLVGVADFGTTRVAHVREVSTNKVKSVREGEQLQEMRVAKIESSRITLEFQGDTDQLELAKFTASGRVPQTPVPPQVAAGAVAPNVPPGIPPLTPPGLPQAPPGQSSPIARTGAADPSTLGSPSSDGSQAQPNVVVNRRTGAVVSPSQREVVNSSDPEARRRSLREMMRQ